MAQPGEAIPRLLPAAYAVSGACALTLQVVWYHAFVDHFGASATTFLVVLCSFIGGLGLGSVASERLFAWIERTFGPGGLERYGYTELAVAASAVLLFALSRVPAAILVGSFPYRSEAREGLDLWVPAVGYLTVKLTMAILAVGGPCLLMGLTFPYLCSLYPAEARLPSRLYAANTLGAALAVLVVQFVGVRLLGYTGCFAFAVAGTGTLGLFFARLRGVRGVGLDQPKPTVAAGESPSLAPGVVSGLLCGGWQALCYVLIKLTLGPTRGVFALLAFFSIIGIWIASSVVHRWRPPRPVLMAAATAGLMWCAVVWFAEPRVSELLVVAGAGGSLGRLGPYWAAVVTAAAAVAFQVFIPYTLWSTLLPDLCDRLQERGHHLARAYGLNTISFLAGVLLFGWILQNVNFFYAARVFGWIAAVSLLMLAITDWERRVALRRALLLSLAATAGLAVAPRSLETRLIGGLSAEEKQVIDYRSTAQHLFWVRPAADGGASLMFDRYSMSGDAAGARVYMRMMAHMPLLLHEHPTRALLICYGVGSTADAIRRHDTIERIDVVDLNPSVYLLNDHFARANGNVLDDPRLRLFCDDGRQFLKLIDERYDLVTLEPPPPLQPGVSRLYSAQFYRWARARLAEGGLVSQWLPESQMDQHGVDLIVATFTQAFEHSFAFVGWRRDIVLVGSDRPFGFEGLLERLSARRAVAADIRRLGFGSPEELLLTLMRSGEGLRDDWGDAPEIRDGFASLEALQVSPAQQLNPEAGYGAAKRGLEIRSDEVAAMLSGDPQLGRAIRALEDSPEEPLAYRRVVPPIYRGRR